MSLGVPLFRATGAMAYAEVAVDAPTGYDRTFTYSIPSPLSLSPGHLILVPFGPRVLQGIVFQVTDVPQVEAPRDVLGLVDPAPLLASPHLELARWMSRYYRTPLFEATAPMLPPGFRARSRAYVGLAAEVPDDLSPDQRGVVDHLGRYGPTEETRMVRRLGRGAVGALRALLRRGVIERTWRWDRRRVGPSYVHHLRLRVSPRQALERADALAARAPRQADLLKALVSEAASTIALARARREYGASAVAGLLARGVAESIALRQERDPMAGQKVVQEPPPFPTPAQAQALAAIRRAMEDPAVTLRTFLLRGVTGSGKTEVYLQALGHCIERGKRAIVLVPEISLTPQMVQRFNARFPRRVAVLHSGLSPGEQFDQWWRVREGAYDVVIGSRSAIFAPQPDLGLVVMDEEHEWAYKQQDVAPRYHARDVALRLAELTGAVLLLGSATPDVTTHYHALSGRYHLLELPERIGAGESASSLAAVQVVDMRRELREGSRGIFSRVLHQALGDCLAAAGQAILFLNRRGAATLVQCRDCGFHLRCRSCDISLTYHLSQGRLLCHQCSRRYRLPSTCPRCSSSRIRYLGLGTQRVVEEVRRLFPSARVVRWDRDVAPTWKAHRRILEQFASGAASVLVGTQMVAKGLHIPAVTLVGVVLADIGLHLPDFRAGERTFQVLCQVAGRAGRGPAGGRVIVQTYSPEHHAIAAAARQDYVGFYQGEVEHRRQHDAPPFSRLIRLVYTHTSPAACEREAERLAAALRHQARVWGLTDVHLIGPAPAYPQRVRGHHRWHLILRGQDPRALLDKVPVPRGWAVDADPVSVM